MFAMDEPQAIEHVRTRLTERFPDLPPETVSLTVQSIHGQFDGRIHDYVPILVEREARSRLEAMSAQRPTKAETSFGGPVLRIMAR